MQQSQANATAKWPPLPALSCEDMAQALARQQACSELAAKLQEKMEHIILRQCQQVGGAISDHILGEFEEFQGRFLRMRNDPGILSALHCLS